jgi:peptidoglycan DL-endopeptidase CwlO
MAKKESGIKDVIAIAIVLVIGYYALKAGVIPKLGDLVEKKVVPVADATGTMTKAQEIQYAADTGHLGPDQLSCLVALWDGESGWRVNAYNDSSGATGIPQSLPADKMASAGADWQTNPRTQIRWGIGYVQGRYGDPCNAYDDWLNRNPHWY